MKLQAIIPVMNHWKVTATCLASLFKSEIPFKYEVFIYDNHSTDLTTSFIKQVQKEGYNVTLITNCKENLGFVGAVNKVLPLLNSEYVLLLNNDVTFNKLCIRNLVETLEKHPEIGILGGMQHDLNWNQLNPIKYFIRGEKATIDNHILMTDYIATPETEKDVIYCDDVHMACAVTPTSILKKFGMDSDYGLGGYDQENYCLQVLEAGYKVGICPKAKYIHTPATTSSDNFIYMQELLNKNRIIFWNRWGQKLRQNLI